MRVIDIDQRVRKIEAANYEARIPNRRAQGIDLYTLLGKRGQNRVELTLQVQAAVYDQFSLIQSDDNRTRSAVKDADQHRRPSARLTRCYPGPPTAAA